LAVPPRASTAVETITPSTTSLPQRRHENLGESRERCCEIVIESAEMDAYDDRACLDELGQYLVSTDAWQRFAIWLLHKHFEPAPGEVFVERVITAPRRTETSPLERSASSAQGLHTTAMLLDPAVGSGLGVIGMEFAEPADFGSTPPLGADDEAVLAGIAERLQSHGKTQRFGVRLIRNPLGLTEQELLLETCDKARRTLHCNVGDRDGIRAPKTVETTWQWQPVPGKTGRTVMQKCLNACEVWTDGEHTANHNS
jgi:hypothetical protein